MYHSLTVPDRTLHQELLDVFQRCGVFILIQLPFSHFWWSRHGPTNGTTFRVPDLTQRIILRSWNSQNINNYDNYGSKTTIMQLSMNSEWNATRKAPGEEYYVCYLLLFYLLSLENEPTATLPHFPILWSKFVPSPRNPTSQLKLTDGSRCLQTQWVYAAPCDSAYHHLSHVPIEMQLQRVARHPDIGRFPHFYQASTISSFGLWTI